jgi:glycerophosphoryl diester phosphodiesterase
LFFAESEGRLPGVTLVYAHRGASKRARENTLRAFVLAKALGAHGIELDARRTQDSGLAIHHDPHLDDGRVICDTSRADLPEYVPDLTQSLDACSGTIVNIEIKNEPGEPDFDATEQVAEAVVALVRARSGRDQILISSFHLPTIDRVRALDPTIATAWLVEEFRSNTVQKLLEHGHVVLHPWVKRVTKALIDECHQHGVTVNTWTCDDPTRMAELTAWGIDGICTNVPDVALGVVNSTRQK